MLIAKFQICMRSSEQFHYRRFLGVTWQASEKRRSLVAREIIKKRAAKSDWSMFVDSRVQFDCVNIFMVWNLIRKVRLPCRLLSFECSADNEARNKRMQTSVMFVLCIWHNWKSSNRNVIILKIMSISKLFILKAWWRRTEVYSNEHLLLLPLEHLILNFN